MSTASNRSAELAQNKIVPLGDIQVPTRFRKDYGHLDDLMRDIHKRGLIHPIAVTTDLVLLAGARRLKACEMLGIAEVPVRVFDVGNASLLGFEEAENVLRKDFTLSERVAIASAISEEMGDGRGDDRIKGDRREIAAKKAGLPSGSLYSRARKVVNTGNHELVKAMDDGIVPVVLASKIADMPRGKQNEIVRLTRGGVKANKAYEQVDGQEPSGDAADEEVQTDDFPAEVRVDQVGQEIPHRLRDVFNSRMLADAARLMVSTSKQLQGVAAWDPYLRIADVMAHIKQVVGLIQSSLPYAVCPACKGKMPESEACTACRCSGFMDENTYTNYEP